MSSEEKRAKWRHYYHQHGELYRVRARERAAKYRTDRTETPEQAEERRRKIREWYARNAEDQRAKRRAYMSAKRGDEPMPDVAAMEEAQLRGFICLLVGLLVESRRERLAKRREWQHARYGTHERKPALPEPIKVKRVPMTVEQRRKKRTDAMRLRRQNDPYFRLVNALRRRVNERLAVQRIKKTQHTMDLIGCTMDHLIGHIEKQFKPGMEWSKFGKGAGCWNLDHLRPVASFDLTTADQQREAFHWSNLSPKWAGENIAKGSVWNGRRWRYADHACVPAPTA